MESKITANIQQKERVPNEWKDWEKGTKERTTEKGRKKEEKVKKRTRNKKKGDINRMLKKGEKGKCKPGVLGCLHFPFLGWTLLPREMLVSSSSSRMFCAFLGAELPASACNNRCSSPSPAMPRKGDQPDPSISGMPLTMSCHQTKHSGMQ